MYYDLIILYKWNTVLKKTIDHFFRDLDIFNFMKLILVQYDKWDYYFNIKIFTYRKGWGCRIVEYLLI